MENATTATGEGFRVSPQQQHVWQQAGALTGADATPWVWCTVVLDGPLDAARLERAVAVLTERHEILRTTVERAPSLVLPVQMIAEGAAAPVEHVDLAHVPADERPAELAAHLDKVSLRWFAAGPGPQLRTVLFGNGDRAATLALGLPALLGDTRSLVLLADELLDAYADPATGADAEPLQYADLAEWLLQLLDDPETAEGRRFWTTAGQQAPAAPFPFEHAAPAGDERPAPAHALELPAAVQAAVGARAAALGISVADLLLTVWQAVQARFADQESGTTGLITDGRSVSDLATAVGPLARTLPVRWDTAAQPALSAAARAAADAVAEARAHENFHLPPADSAPTYGTAFEFVELPPAREVHGLTAALRSVGGTAAPRTLTATWVRRGDLLSLRLTAPHTFGPYELALLAEAYTAALAALADGTDLELAALPLTAGTVEQPAGRFPQEHTAGTPVHLRVARQAALTPDAEALTGAAERLTYRQLDDRVQALAAHLQSLGAEPGERIPLLLHRGTDAVVAMLAVLTAGGCFVPVDPEQPRERLAFVLADTGARFVVTEPGTEGLLPEDGPRAVSAVQPATAARAEARESGAAYVIYTSGTTGRPKGVVVGHAQLSHYTDAAADRLPLGPAPRFALVSTLAADLGYTALLAALCSGGALHVVDQDTATDPTALGELMRTEGIDCLKIVPSHLTALLTAAADPAALIPRRLLITGGEACTWALLDRVAELAPHCAVVNHYGPTETTIGVSAHRVDGAELDRRCAVVPLGPALGGNALHVRDEALRPLPDWVPGELCVSGPGLAEGYLGQDELTAQRFVETAGPDGTPVRLYRTGDRVRRLPDGTFDFLGRTDDQIKINGFRVELGEIDAALRSHPGVQDCFVRPVTDPHGANRVIGYLVTPTADPSDAELRQHLRDRLAEQLVPGAFVRLAALPRTPNGKVDRAALPEPAHQAAATTVGPRNSVELALLTMWEELLDRSGLSVTDDFFDVGGHSLLAVKLTVRIHKELGRKLALSEIFEARTVEAMAALLRRQEARTARHKLLVQLKAGAGRKPLFLFHGGRGSAVWAAELARALPADRPVHCLEAPGLDGTEEPVADLRAMAERYVAAIRAVQPSGPYLLGSRCLGGMFAHEVSRRLAEQGQETALLVLIDSPAPNPRALEEMESGTSNDPFWTGLEESTLLHRFAAQYGLDPALPEAGSAPEAERQALLLAELRTHGLVEPDAGPQELESMLGVYRSNLRAVREYVRSYAAQGTQAGPTVIFRSEDSRTAPEHDALGWDEVLPEEPALEVLPGDYHTLIAPPRVQALADGIHRALESRGL
ncbi:amino acid adenylation domain-containing protein [Streptomyces sp. NPDC089919]|uniref:non-ribosomal peptide synthetase n=1 Tax=Streptomyces sp. NPDC089919 TaxID=3155188 RepID=UPI00344966E5